MSLLQSSSNNSSEAKQMWQPSKTNPRLNSWLCCNKKEIQRYCRLEQKMAKAKCPISSSFLCKYCSKGYPQENHWENKVVGRFRVSRLSSFAAMGARAARASGEATCFLGMSLACPHPLRRGRASTLDLLSCRIEMSAKEFRETTEPAQRRARTQLD